MKEYDRARLQVLVHGTEEERDKLHLYDGHDRTVAFMLGVIAGFPFIAIMILCLMVWHGGVPW